MNKKTNSSNLPSYLRDVETSVGVFRIQFPHGVFRPDDPWNKIPKAVANHVFEATPVDATEKVKKNIADQNAAALQKALNKAGRFGTKHIVVHSDVSWADRLIHVN